MFLILDIITKLINSLAVELKKGKEIDLVKTGHIWNVIEEIVNSKTILSNGAAISNIQQNNLPIIDQIKEKLLVLFEQVDGGS